MKLDNKMVAGVSGLLVSIVIVLSIGAVDIFSYLFIPIVGISMISVFSGSLIKSKSKLLSVVVGGASAAIVCTFIILSAVSNI